jgi:hypothetical protein
MNWLTMYSFSPQIWNMLIHYHDVPKCVMLSVAFLPHVIMIAPWLMKLWHKYIINTNICVYIWKRLRSSIRNVPSHTMSPYTICWPSSALLYCSVTNQLVHVPSRCITLILRLCEHIVSFWSSTCTRLLQCINGYLITQWYLLVHYFLRFLVTAILNQILCNNKATHVTSRTRYTWVKGESTSSLHTVMYHTGI